MSSQSREKTSPSCESLGVLCLEGKSTSLFKAPACQLCSANLFILMLFFWGEGVQVLISHYRDYFLGSEIKPFYKMAVNCCGL